MNNFTQILQKLVSIDTTSNNFKAKSKSKLLTNVEKSYIQDNFAKFVLSITQIEKKLFAEHSFKLDKVSADKYKISVKKYRELGKKADDICKCFNAGYSMGGVIYCYVSKGTFTQTLGIYSDCTDYAKSSTYRAIHGWNSFTLTLNELEKIEIIGGIPTIKLTNSKIAECVQFIGVGRKNNYKITSVKGFVTNNYHANTIQDCKNWRERMYLQRIKERNLSLYNETIVLRKEQALKKFVGFNHSIQAGNCEVGTKAFAQKHNLDIRFGYSLEYIKSLEPNSIFIERLFNNFM